MHDKTKYTTVYLIRHGETEWNRERRFQGHQDSPLTETGQCQAAALGKRLKPIGFDAIFASDLGRARQTAAIIAGFGGTAVILDNRLRERNYGILEGLPEVDIRAQFPEVLARLRSRDPDYVIPQGESHRGQYHRNIAFLEEITERKAGSRIAVVAHGGVLDSFFRYICDLDLTRPRYFVTANTSLAILILNGAQGSPRGLIRTWGDISHLDGIQWNSKGL